MNPLEDPAVLLRDGLALRSVADALAEQGRVRVEALVGQPPEHDDALVEGLAGDEPRRAEPHPVPAHEASDVAVVGGAQDHRAEGRVRRLRDAHAAAVPSSSVSHDSSDACSAVSRSRSGGRTSGRTGMPRRPITRLSAACRGTTRPAGAERASRAAPTSVGSRTTAATSAGNADASAETAPTAPASRPRWISDSGPTKTSNPSSR